MNAVEIIGLRKEYGKTTALDGIDLEISPGEVFGLIGPNGSGKTTTLRILGTLIKPTAGTAAIFGTDVVRDPGEARLKIGYLPEEAGVYNNLTGEDYLRFVGTLYSQSKSEVDEMVAKGADISGLGARLKDKAGGYSQGMKRRLLIARVMMLSPRLAILDEPTSGLDVINSTHVRTLIRQYVKDFGVTLLLSSHNMLEVDYLCDRIVLVNGGRIVARGTPKEVKDQSGAPNLEEAFMRVIAHG
ncbi:MAG TPA: ABC transporter ATP-binding protein [Nitrososphaerales archaeon]|nr:ABC transporter ATP-binding protein [Nitrososphaerales archaeon]